MKRMVDYVVRTNRRVVKYAILECVNYRSNKFYAVFEAPHGDVTTAFGPKSYWSLDNKRVIGLFNTSGYAKSQNFDRLVDEKLDRGYILVQEGRLILED